METQNLSPHRHRWYTPKWAPSLIVCRTCGASQDTVGADSACLIARHPDPAINKLYRERRKAARAADDGRSAARGWATLERIEAELRAVDPDGDWRHEGDRYDGRGWRVNRAASEAGIL